MRNIMAQGTSNKRATERRAKRLDKAKMATTRTTENPIDAFRSGNPDRAYDAVQTLQDAKRLPFQVANQNGQNKAKRMASNTWNEKAAEADRRRVAEADQLIDDLGKEYMDGMGDREPTAKDAAVNARLNRWGMNRGMQEAYMGRG